MSKETIGRPLTERQGQIYQFIRSWITAKRMPPTIREIANEFGIRSPHGVRCHLDSLVKKGMITRNAKFSRGISLVESPTCPHCGKPLTEEPS